MLFSASKVLFICKMGAFFAKNVLFFPWKGAVFKCFFFAKVHYDPYIVDLCYHANVVTHLPVSAHQY